MNEFVLNLYSHLSVMWLVVGGIALLMVFLIVGVNIYASQVKKNKEKERAHYIERHEKK